MLTLVMTVIAAAIAKPSVQANRLGLADTQSGGWLRVIARETTRIGLYWKPIVTRIRNSTKKKLVTIFSGKNRWSK